MKRKIIKIDESKCNGCGECVPDCPEGALKVVNGKARIVSELLCDGLGACIGRCPKSAITIEEREAGGYSECKVMDNVVGRGKEVISAHLKHLKEHGQEQYLSEAKKYLEGHKISTSGIDEGHKCHGMMAMDYRNTAHDEPGASIAVLAL